MTDFQSGTDLANANGGLGFRKVFLGVGLITFGVVLLVILAKTSVLPAQTLGAVSVPALIIFVGPGLLLILAGLVEAVSGRAWSSLGAGTRGILLVIGIPIICIVLFFGVGLAANYIQDQMSIRLTPRPFPKQYPQPTVAPQRPTGANANDEHRLDDLYTPLPDLVPISDLGFPDGSLEKWISESEERWEKKRKQNQK